GTRTLRRCPPRWSAGASGGSWPTGRRWRRLRPGGRRPRREGGTGCWGRGGRSVRTGPSAGPREAGRRSTGRAPSIVLPILLVHVLVASEVEDVGAHLAAEDRAGHPDPAVRACRLTARGAPLQAVVELLAAHPAALHETGHGGSIGFTFIIPRSARGGVAQLVRASGSYPLCPGFKSLHRHQISSKTPSVFDRCDHRCDSSPRRTPETGASRRRIAQGLQLDGMLQHLSQAGEFSSSPRDPLDPQPSRRGPTGVLARPPPKFPGPGSGLLLKQLQNLRRATALASHREQPLGNVPPGAEGNGHPGPPGDPAESRTRQEEARASRREKVPHDVRKPDLALRVGVFGRLGRRIRANGGLI